MRSLFRREPEPAKVFAELVASSYTMLVPAAIMAAIFLAVGLFCAERIGGLAPRTAIIAGMLASFGRLAVILAYRRQVTAGLHEQQATAAWEFRLALTTVSFGAALALLGVCSFLSSSLTTQMLTTGLLFGFCSGAVARGYIRPRVCSACVSVATIPVAVACAAHGGPGHWIMAAMFFAFLLGSLETIRYGYRQIREQIALREDLSTVARHDPLTGLANRFGLRQAFADLLQAKANLPMLAVHCFDLDRFKPVNDRFGHPAGDALLHEMASRVRATLRPGDLAARLGGDEFVVVQAHIGRAEEAEMFARRLARAITLPYAIAGESIEIGVSLGYATSPPSVASLGELLSDADVILYRVKHGGGGVGSADSFPAPPGVPHAVGW